MEEEVSKLEKQGITLRKIKSTDLFLMSTIISKLGINEFVKCFKSEGIKGLIQNVSKNMKDKDKKKSETEEKDDATITVGVGVALEIANVILANLYKCEKEIYQLFANLSGKSTKEIEDLDVDIFIEMIIAFVKKDEFKDFFKAASKFLK